MSSENIIGKRYARAIFELAQEKQIADQVGEELSQIVQMIASNEELKNLLEHPVVEKSVKQKVFKEALQGKVSDVVLNALHFIFEKGRERNLPAIQQAYFKIANEAAGRVQAVVYSAYPLSEQNIANIQAKFGAITQKTIEVQNEVDPSIIGGLKVKIGDTLYDGSFAGKLEEMRKFLSEAKAM